MLAVQTLEHGFDLVRRVNMGAMRSLKGGDNGEPPLILALCMSSVLRAGALLAITFRSW